MAIMCQAIEPEIREAGASDREDRMLLARLRAGDEEAFEALVRRYHASLVRLALSYVPSRAVAEEVVQETWLGVLRGIDRFQGRSSLRTWIFRILVNRARTHGQREGRSVPFSALPEPDQRDGPSVEPDRFLGPGHRWAGSWAIPPQRWAAGPEDSMLARETLEVVRGAVDALPPKQRAVILLRDVQGLDAGEVCGLLGVSAGNQRVLLHRARSRVRASLDAHLKSHAVV